MKRLLILSNNVISDTKNNGKTIYSFIKGQDIEVFQLYLSGEIPRIEGYQYFRINDKNIINGFFNKKRRGGRVTVDTTTNQTDDFSIRTKIGRNQFTLVARDILWHKRWKSEQLDVWLNLVSPDALFFVAGDTLFSYEICEYIYSKYVPRLTVYVTDDYVMPCIHEDRLHAYRRKKITNAMRSVLRNTTCFYTISNRMKDEYKKLFGIDSHLIVNITESLRDPSFSKPEPEIVLTYTGSFYYHRSDVLIELAKLVKAFNENNPLQPARLMLYSNKEPDKEIYESLCIEGASKYAGSLNPEQLKERLNTSDILVFVESFDPIQIEKVKYSLSTKVPEYMSTGKPILAIGPKGIGSMDYLNDIACCVYELSQIKNELFNLIKDKYYRDRLGKLSYRKYTINHNKENLRQDFFLNVIGGTEKKSEDD